MPDLLLPSKLRKIPRNEDAVNLRILTLAALAAINTLNPLPADAKCTGGICTSCTNCSRCQHCSKQGGSCSACRPDLYRGATGAPRQSTSAPAQWRGPAQTRPVQQRRNPAPTRTAARPAAAQPRAPKTYAPITGRCVSVSDGDTLTLLVNERQHKIRLHAIDAPEKRQDFGTRAKNRLSELAFGKTLTAYTTSIDRYGRTVAWVFAGQLGLNAEMVRSGLAWRYDQYAQGDTKLAGIQATARAAKRGLWSQASPTAPWVWRRQQRN